MTLEGAINLNETNDYVIYTMNSVTTGQYGVVVPKNISSTVNMLIDLGMKSTFDGVGNGSKTKEQLVLEIEDEYKLLKTKYNFGMLVMPMIDSTLFSNIVNNGDKQKMFDEVKKIGAITSELYKKLTESGIAKHMIDQKIVIIEKKTEDIKFVDWLRVQMPNFVDGILYSEFTGNTGGATVLNNNDIFASVPSVEVPNTNVAAVSNVSSNVSSGGIFDNVQPVVTTAVPSVNENASVSNIEQVNNVPTNSSVTPIISEPVEASSSLVGSNTNVVSSSESAIPIASGIDFGNIFETKPENVAPVAPTPVADVIPTQNVEAVSPVVEAPANSMVSNNMAGNLNSAVVNNVAPVMPTIEPPMQPVVENPVNVQTAPSVQPINNNFFSSPVSVENVNVPNSQPIPVISNTDVVGNSVVEDGPKPVEGTALDGNVTFASVSEQVEDSDEADDSNKSKGFVNLAILLGVIVAVTFVSIEIGKYLYNTFGA